MFVISQINVKVVLISTIIIIYIKHSEQLLLLDNSLKPCFYLASPLTKPRPPSATSIPAILKSLQDEWVSNKYGNGLHTIEL